MWKLTITQSRKSEYSGNVLTETVEFIHDSLEELVVTVERLKMCATVCETSYKIESVAKAGE